MGENITNERKKMGKRLQRTPNQIGFLNDHNHMKRCSATLVIGEIQIKKDNEIHQKIRKTYYAKCWWRCGTQEWKYPSRKVQMDASTMENCVALSPKAEHSSCNSNSTSGYRSNRNACTCVTSFVINLNWHIPMSIHSRMYKSIVV